MAERLGLDAVRADLAPDEKVQLILVERKTGLVMMVGDAGARGGGQCRGGGRGAAG